jgi:hypothetical protein
MHQRSPAYWFRVPDDETMLMSLKPAQLRCYLVVMRDIQCAKNHGLISARQVAGRTRVSLKHTHAALETLVTRGILSCVKKRGATAKYSLPYLWVEREKKRSTVEGEQNRNRLPVGEHPGHRNCPPTGEQQPDNPDSPGLNFGEQYRSPEGTQNCFPTGEQHLEPLEYSDTRTPTTKPTTSPASKKTASKTGQVGGSMPVDDPSVLAVDNNFETRGWTEKDLLKARAWAMAFLDLETISEGFEISMMLATGTAPAADVLDLLNNMLKDSHYQLGGRWSPKTNPEAWLLAVLEDKFRGQHLPEPTSGESRFRAADHTMTASFDTLDKP